MTRRTPTHARGRAGGVRDVVGAVRAVRAAGVACVIAPWVAASAGCPGSDCTGPAKNAVLVAGKSCTACVVDFGAVDVGLQGHSRIEMQSGCTDFGFDGVSIDGEPAFTLGQPQLPQVAGGFGFVDVTFTPATTTAVTGTVHIDPAFDVTVKGAGKAP